MKAYDFRNVETGLDLVWTGHSPVDAIVRFWATCLPDTELSGPLLCMDDGVTYHTSLKYGYRMVYALAPAVQFRPGETTLTVLPNIDVQQG